MKTRLEVLCNIHGQQGGTIADFNRQYSSDFLAMRNIDFLKFVYCVQLKRARQTMPEMYSWPEIELEQVMQRMSAAIDKMSFNKDSPAWIVTCRALGIPHTYKAIREFRDAV